MTLEHELMTIEKNFWTGGPEAYHQFADNQCLIAFADMAGVVSNGDIARTARKGRWSDIEMKKKGLAELSDTAAVLTYEARTRREDGKPYRAIVSSGYVKRSTGWKLAFHQQTPLG